MPEIVEPQLSFKGITIDRGNVPEAERMMGDEASMMENALRVISGQTKTGWEKIFISTDFYPQKGFKSGENPSLPDSLVVLLEVLKPTEIAKRPAVGEKERRDPSQQIFSSETVYRTDIKNIYLIQENRWQPNSRDDRVTVNLKLVRDDPKDPQYSLEALEEFGFWKV